MYTKLTKVVTVDDRECVTCAFYGTDECRIHTRKITDCAHCEMMGAMINQLHAFEEHYDQMSTILKGEAYG